MTAEKLFFHTKTFLLLLGLGLTLFSLSEICSAQCGEVHNYRLYGFKFETVGLLFFSSGLLLHFASLYQSFCSLLLFLLVFGGVGAEIEFILFQKYTIGSWCPVCLTIAATVGLLASVLMAQMLLQRGNTMEKLFKGISSFSIVLAGLLMALFGIAQPENTFAEGVKQNDPVFGNKKSDVEVYIITDWFCPACRHADPFIDQALPDLFKVARVFFIDKIIHQDSMNYVPYNLSFMINNKNRYLQIRRALIALTDKTKEPSPQDVQNAVKPLGVTYKQLNYSDINSGMQFFEGIVKHFQIHQTPTVVVANRHSLKATKLVGAEINREHLLEAVQQVQ